MRSSLNLDLPPDIPSFLWKKQKMIMQIKTLSIPRNNDVQTTITMV
jgi:hypothetical protein